jgi:hypothetical protein
MGSGRSGIFSFLFFRNAFLNFFSCHFVLFYFVSNSNKPFNVCSSEKILLLVFEVFWCSSLGDTLAFAHFGFSSHGIVFLATLETMCHLSLRVWKKKKHIVCFCCCLYKIFKILNFCFVFIFV